jgi:hypothetical protein
MLEAGDEASVRSLQQADVVSEQKLNKIQYEAVFTVPTKKAAT